MTWSDGYPVHSGHRFLYHRSGSPTYASHVLRQAGYAVPALRVCCELGFGQGVSLAVHAACGGEWWGADFMPGQVALARDLAGGRAHLSDEDFASFCARPDLPEFDYICIIGVWSWISAENRRVVLDFLRRKLRPGGVFHVTYNTAVGWAPLLPLRHLLVQHAAVNSPPGHGPVAAVEAALPDIQRVLDAHCAYAVTCPAAPAMAQRMREAGGRMVVHEFMGRHWTLFHFADVVEEMATAKLDYACGAARLPTIPALYWKPEQAALLAEIPDPGFRETVAEFMAAERYRRDYWIKGARRLEPEAAARAAASLRYVLAVPPDLPELRLDLPRGELVVERAAFGAVTDALSDGRPHRLDAILAAAARHGLQAEAARAALMALWDAGAVHPAQDGDEAAAAASAGCRALNGRIMAATAEGGGIEHLASPVTGGAIPAPRLHQALLLAERAGHGGDGRAVFAAGITGSAPDGAALREFDRHRPVLQAHGIT